MAVPVQKTIYVLPEKCAYEDEREAIEKELDPLDGREPNAFALRLYHHADIIYCDVYNNGGGNLLDSYKSESIDAVYDGLAKLGKSFKCMEVLKGMKDEYVASGGNAMWNYELADECENKDWLDSLIEMHKFVTRHALESMTHN